MKKTRGELLHSLIETLAHVCRNITAGQSFPFGEIMLSRPQVFIVFMLARRNDGIAVKNLAKSLNVTSGAVTQMIDSLIEKGLVQREANPEDRRALLIKLTKSAKSNFPAFKKNYLQSFNPMFDGLNDEELQQFILLLNKVSITLEPSGQCSR